MAVDEKFVQEVKNEDEYEDIMAELGLEGSFHQSGNGIDLTGYEVTQLREMYPGDDYVGKPIISDIYKVEFKNKDSDKTTVNYKIDLILKDDTYEDEKEAYVFTCNLREENIDFDKNIVKDVYNTSGLYALAMGLAELKAKGISKSFNHLDVVGIKKLQKDVSQYESMTVNVVEKKMVDKNTKEENYYNSFKIVSAE